MAHGHTPQLPEIFPQGDVKVEDEKHRYQTFEGDSNSVLEQTEYTLDKAPIHEIVEVTGVVDGSTVEFDKSVDYQLDDLIREKEDDFTFEEIQEEYVLDDGPDAGSTVIVDESGDTYDQGTDYGLFDTNEYEQGTIQFLEGGSSPDDGEDFTVTYTVTYQDSIIKWDSAQTTPDAGSFFYVTYRSESILSRYSQASSEQLASIEDELIDVIEGKFVDSAEGQELDEIGSLFGILGKRSGRDDTQYRIYLKSIVQSFVSRGTVQGIKLAISAATEVPLEDITIDEDFQDNEYQVIVVPDTPVRGRLLEQISDIADPSGIEQSGTTFDLPPDEMGADDRVTFTEGQQISDALTVSDSVANYGFGTEGAAFEDILSDDTVAIDPNKHTVPDQMAVLDAVATPRASATETMTANETVALDPNLTTTTDTLTANEAVALDPNLTTVAESSGMADAAVANRASASEDMTIQEGIATDPNKVSWDETNWNEFNWATQNN